MGMSLLPVIYIIYFTIECYKPTPLSWSRVGGVPSASKCSTRRWTTAGLGWHQHPVGSSHCFVATQFELGRLNLAGKIGQEVTGQRLSRCVWRSRMQWGNIVKVAMRSIVDMVEHTMLQFNNELLHWFNTSRLGKDVVPNVSFCSCQLAERDILLNLLPDPLSRGTQWIWNGGRVK